MNFKRFMLKLAGENLARKIRKMKNLINQMRTIDQLAEQMEKVSYDVWNIYPNSIILTDNIKETVGVFRQKNNIPPELNLNVSKSDIMFLYVLRNIKKFAALHNMNLKNDSTYAEKYAVAYDLYLQHGLNSMNIIRKLIEHKYGGIEHVDSFLDFGSGYGKFTRFLTLEIDPSKVWVCDRKGAGVQFQVEQLGVNGFVSSLVPERLNPERTFDVVYAASVFSHLPVDLFQRWLGVLYNLISENGMLVISVHDASLGAESKNKESHYQNINEDIQFREVDDRIEDDGDYGTMYVSEEFMRQQLKNIGVNDNQYYRYPKGLGCVQDLYVITKCASSFNNELDFSTFP